MPRGDGPDAAHAMAPPGGDQSGTECAVRPRESVPVDRSKRLILAPFPGPFRGPFKVLCRQRTTGTGSGRSVSGPNKAKGCKNSPYFGNNALALKSLFRNATKQTVSEKVDQKRRKNGIDLGKLELWLRSRLVSCQFGKCKTGPQ